MSVYLRYKKQGMDGFRNLVALLETTPLERRRKMIEVGMLEDAEYTQQALGLLMSFSDILALVPVRITAMAIHPLARDVHARFLAHAPRKKQADLQVFLQGAAPALGLVGGAQLQMVGHLRELEKQGKIQLKKIPEKLEPSVKGALQSA